MQKLLKEQFNWRIDMPTLTGSNVLEWKMKELAKRSGKKYEPENKPKSIYDGMTSEELKKHQNEIKSLLEDN
jgi:hypothetical protein